MLSIQRQSPPLKILARKFWPQHAVRWLPHNEDTEQSSGPLSSHVTAINPISPPHPWQALVSFPIVQSFSGYAYYNYYKHTVLNWIYYPKEPWDPLCGQGSFPGLLPYLPVCSQAHRAPLYTGVALVLPSSSRLSAPCPNSRSRSLNCAPQLCQGPCRPSAGPSHSAASILPCALPVQWVSAPMVLAHLNPKLHWSHLLAMLHDYALLNWTTKIFPGELKH